MLDPDLTVINSLLIMSMWKVLMFLITIPIFSRIPVDTAICSSGVLENYSDAWNEVTQDRKIILLWSFGLVTVPFGAITCLWIIKYQNAMQKVVVSLLV